jgi:hypothetical protein
VHHVIGCLLLLGTWNGLIWPCLVILAFMQYESIVVVVKLLHSNLLLTPSLAKPLLLPFPRLG